MVFIYFRIIYGSISDYTWNILSNIWNQHEDLFSLVSSMQLVKVSINIYLEYSFLNF